MSSVKDTLYRAFQRYNEYPETVVPIADIILSAATEAPKLYFVPTSSGRLTIAIGNDEPFEVALPYESISSFRTLLARFGVICAAAAEKRSFIGKIKAFLMRAGFIADKMVTERKNQVIRYDGAVIYDQPASPLYKVDAELDVMRPDGVKKTLHVMMQNQTQDLFLIIEPRL